MTRAPGQHATVHFTLNASDLAYWDTAAQGWAVGSGSYQVYVGDSSAPAGLPLQGSFIDAGRQLLPRAGRSG